MNEALARSCGMTREELIGASIWEAVPLLREREAAFAAINNIPSIKAKAEFCFRWMESIESLNLALDNYPGTLIFVSHDASLEGLFDRTVRLAEINSVSFSGDGEPSPPAPLPQAGEGRQFRS